MSIFNMDRGQFLTALADKTTPENVLDNAPRIYGFMSTLFNENALDSVLREWAFQWATEELEIEYQVIYDKWLSASCL